jgi:hypothetical protein
MSPREELQGFKINTRWYAELWLRRGEPHPAEHHIIRERLARWRQRVSADPALRAELLEEIGPEPTPAPRPVPRVWVSPGMPLGGAAEAQDEQNDPGPDTDTPEKSDLPTPAEISTGKPRDGRVSLGQGRWGHKRPSKVKGAAA